ncbi:hypothetical protein FGB62_173g07 [Gracilaria domingensis]|nr:hypothetical protein FGB62_173g07 [Gracilaria domingensis]
MKAKLAAMQTAASKRAAKANSKNPKSSRDGANKENAGVGSSAKGLRCDDCIENENLDDVPIASWLRRLNGNRSVRPVLQALNANVKAVEALVALSEGSHQRTES